MSTGFPIPTTIPQTRAAAQAVEDILANANPTNYADSEAVSRALQAVRAVLTQLNQEDMLSRDGAMHAVTADLNAPLQTLSGLKDQLTEISARVSMLAGIANHLDQVMTGCTKIFGV